MKIGIIRANTAQECAVICATLAKENIRFEAEDVDGTWIITITGY